MEERTFPGPPNEPEEVLPAEDAVLLSSGPDAVARTVLYLSWIRSVGVVMRALSERFPDPASWERQMADPAFHEEIAAFNGVVADVRSVALAGGQDLGALESAGSAHMGRALESLALTAERLGVTPDDLLVVLVHA